MTNTKIPSETPTEPEPTKGMPMINKHFITGNPIKPPFPEKLQQAVFGLGCFWGAERRFWQQAGVYSTAVGYTAGTTPNPDYKQVCTGLTGHSEVVMVVYEPHQLSFQQLLQIFWESHNPTQGMRQGNDTGSQYRSGIYYYSDQQKEMAEQSRQNYQKQLIQAGFGQITTEILPVSEFYYAEDYHQQYLAKNSSGYCGLGGTGVCY